MRESEEFCRQKKYFLNFNIDMHKEILFGSALREKLNTGVETVVKAVSCTMGVDGKYVIIETKENGYIRITKDGVSVANEIFLSDPHENMGAKMIIDSAIGTVKRIGDGTTTTTLFAGALWKILCDLGVKPNIVKRKIAKELEVVKRSIEALKKECDGSEEILYKVAMVSSNHNEEISKNVAEVYSKIGADGLVSLKTHDAVETNIVYSDGITVRQGFFHRTFTNKGGSVFETEKGCFVLCVNGRVDSLKPIVDAMSRIFAEKSAPILIFADGFDDSVITAMHRNKTNDNIIVPLEKPTINSDKLVEDLAVALGGVYVDGVNVRMADVTKDHFGFAKNVKMDFEKSVFEKPELNRHQKLIYDQHLEVMRSEEEAVLNDMLKQKVKHRIARIEGKIATIIIGAPTESELGFKYDVYDDVTKAVKSCVTNGYVAGGGSIYLSIKKELLKEFGDDSILAKVMHRPLEQMLTNSDYEDIEIKDLIDKISGSDVPSDYGYDLMEIDLKPISLLDKGIVEPANLPYVCIENASSVATLLFSSEASIAIDRIMQI